MWNQVRSDALQTYVHRNKQYTFADGPLANLLIQEYWDADIHPPGGEQRLTFYQAPVEQFRTVYEFAAIVRFFEWENDLPETAREESAPLANLKIVPTGHFAKEWQFQAAKVRAAPVLPAGLLLSAMIVNDEWNDKFFVASSAELHFALCWGTSA